MQNLVKRPWKKNNTPGIYQDVHYCRRTRKFRARIHIHKGWIDRGHKDLQVDRFTFDGGRHPTREKAREVAAKLARAYYAAYPPEKDV